MNTTTPLCSQLLKYCGSSSCYVLLTIDYDQMVESIQIVPPPPSPPPTHTHTRLRVPPESLDQLSDSLDLLDQLQSDIPKFEAQFEPLHDQFNILRKYEVQIPEEVEHQLEGLQGNWMAFQQCLIDSEGMLKKHKVML